LAEIGQPVDFDARRAWMERRLSALRSDGDVIVVGLDTSEKPAGFVVVDPRGALDQLCVAPAERGSGLASALLDEAKRRSPGVVELDVN
jgi:putative acetyltransferase